MTVANALMQSTNNIQHSSFFFVLNTLSTLSIFLLHFSIWTIYEPFILSVERA